MSSVRAHRRQTSAPRDARDPRILPSTAADRRALHRIEKFLDEHLGRGEELAWTIGRRFDEIARRGLHHAAGFATLEEYGERRFPQGYRTLKRYRRVAIAFTRATVRKHGVSKLELALTYIALTPEDER